ncbi:hypothetical protein [Halapricum desulfuricans]|uniref:Uncharacterized protein n=1 Tax=Halapricum desulfuricans TaxID=2841257 RepID=A0A897NVB1_9EURY|nr:hypothetical protein [Halapricum desulfuricans]QSG16171.1 Uncharacterized protein HSEST_2661 [Halapricum desulfuricans]
MICPSCDFDFDPARGLQCPRCGEAIDCSEIGCANCDACNDVFQQVTRRIRSGD